MDTFWLCFVPLFIAVDAIGVLPLFVALTGEYNPKKLPKLILQSMFTASIVALAFLYFGQVMLAILSITPITIIIGRNGTRTISKVASLLLTAIAVMLIRKGIMATIG